jgi:hypothetical protein
MCGPLDADLLHQVRFWPRTRRWWRSASAGGPCRGRPAQARASAPWGLALAPKSFGRFGGDLLIGNFGDGRINAYERTTGSGYAFDGALRGRNGQPLAIDGLWALSFGKGAKVNGPTDTLFFTAGPRRGDSGPVREDPRLDSYATVDTANRAGDTN